MGMLYQIERKLAGIKKEIEMREKDAADVRATGSSGLASRALGSKVVAVDVDPELYAALQAAAKVHGVRGVRGALLLAAKVGLRHL
jgi:predicted RNA methylase